MPLCRVRPGPAAGLRCRASPPTPPSPAPRGRNRSGLVGGGAGQGPDGGIEALAPARVEIAEPGADARGVGVVHNHAAARQLGLAGEIDRLDILTLQFREMLRVAL